MKNLIYGLLALSLTLFVISACNKGSLSDNKNGQLTASSYKVKINQPDSLLLVGAKATDTTRWSIVPSGHDSIITKNNTALIFFKKPGSYLVKAINGITTATASVTVSDSVYHPAGQHTIVSLIGDQVTLVPHYYKSKTSDSAYLSFVAQTHNSYCSNSSLKFADSVVNNSYGIGFLNVIQPAQCTLGITPIAAVINFTQNQPDSLPNGTFPLNVTLNGITYTGSIVATTTTITFNWNYNAGVLIAPKQISK
ncbi:hypothetical protein [Mucilaginibacter sp.]|uniref:hypothetical protein n=1 Tax=Mucilaginibacter sp. TaxID=1882438 RepID=UPI0026034158|nr:hypothetical protein [Mucilaginibacter sp.]MDB4920944.1 hypothetical protein [Mucilaginibacter sp.]